MRIPAIVNAEPPAGGARRHSMASLQDRVIGAMTLQATTFEEVEHDGSATSQAALVVLLAAISNGIAWLWYGGLTGVVENAVWALVSWVLWAGLMWIIGTKVMPGRNTEADLGQLLRTMGFAQAPRLLSFIGIIPIIGWVIVFALFVWTLVATVIAVRQALDYDSTLRALLAVGLAFVCALVLTFLFALLTSFRTAVLY
jgi:hypothetical protein